MAKRRKMAALAVLAVAIAMALGAAGARAQQTLGPETNLPLPRFVSMKASEANVRRGPSRTHRIDWVYRVRDLPLLITAEYGNWRRVEDRDGQGGWIHYSLLSGVRTVLVEADEVPLRMKPVADAPEVAIARRGVVARVDSCVPDWCRIRKDGYKGWAEKAALWGVGPDEIIE